MDVRPDTSSSRFRGQLEWSFLHNSPQDAQARSLPPSSYIRSDRSSTSPAQQGQYHTVNGSRSSFSRNILSTSTGARSTTTTSQPVCLPVHSADASAHLQPTPRLSRKPIKMNKQTDLPAIEEYSFQGILASIHEDVEADINIISEILGRSRLVLADQHDSHMPPQGEIIANGNTLQAVEEASASNEQLADDNVLIMREDASLADGSNSGSAAYGLLERLQAMPRNMRTHSDVSPLESMPEPPPVARHYSSPEGLGQVDLTNSPEGLIPASPTLGVPSSLTAGRGPAQAVVSETYLSAEVNHSGALPTPIVSESGRHYPLYTHDDSEIFSPQTNIDDAADTTSPPRNRFPGMSLGDLMGLSSWLNGRSSGSSSQDAEARLRVLLNR